MPYNTTAIPPRREATGTAQLPLSRVRKMIMQDQEIAEMFIQYIAEQGHNVVKSEKKPRRNIQYRDLSRAVQTLDNLEFLVDVVPRTVPFKEIKAKKTSAPKNSAVNGEGSGSVEAGQTTLDGQQPPALNGNSSYAPAGGSAMYNDSVDSAPYGSIDDGDNDPNTQLEMESMRGQRQNSGSAGLNGNEGGEDVEMS
ncbi:DNA polymerase epsilon subunit C [Lachnellula suecica]|uniref:DNA polymerase epsilon subunit C n=1 Tax=Lachnellula suecica TaxID=602035 RepID=A0A8T9CET4_9HELO|nr:DNA polymerase epsilon subunit C [Lachnellula suecica]